MTTTPYQMRSLGDATPRNLILNGNFDWWQRGITLPVSTTDKYLADRFITSTSGFSLTTSRSTDVPTQAQSGFQSAYSMLVTNQASGASPTAGQFVNVQYRMEGLDYQAIHGRKVRLQFWVKSSVPGTYSIGLSNQGQTRYYVTTYTVASASVWQKINLDLPLDTAGTWIFDNSLGMFIFWGLAWGSSSQTSNLNSWQNGSFPGATTQTQWSASNNATFQLAQVALYAGAFDSTLSIPYQRCGRNAGHELQLCQRYHYRPDFENANNGTWLAVGQVGSGGTTCYITLPLPTAMRTLPTLNRSGTVLNNASGAVVAITGMSMGAHGNSANLSVNVASGLVAGNATLLQKNGATDFIEFIAEL